MKRLTITCEDRKLRLETRWIVQGANLDDDRIRPNRRPRQEMRTARSAELSGHWAVQIAALIRFRFALGHVKIVNWNSNEHVWSTARNVLALAAMALSHKRWFAISFVSHFSAVASTCRFHGDLSCFSAALRNHHMSFEITASSGHGKGQNDLIWRCLWPMRFDRGLRLQYAALRILREEV